MLKNPFDRPASTVDAVVPERLKGASVERIRIVEHLAYLRSLAPSVERFGSYAAVLSGENSDAIGGYHLDQAFLKERGFSTYAKSRKLGNGSFAITWDTGCDVNALAEDPAKELLRYKFYLSLDLSSPDRLVAAQALIESVLHGARRERLSIQTKSESHAYDTNYILIDLDPSYGAAFANWRTNPNTSEVRGASVYFSSLWAQIADLIFTDDTTLTALPKIDKPGSLFTIDLDPWED
jgi:hypothetical protein